MALNEEVPSLSQRRKWRLIQLVSPGVLGVRTRWRYSLSVHVVTTHSYLARCSPHSRSPPVRFHSCSS